MPSENVLYIFIPITCLFCIQNSQLKLQELYFVFGAAAPRCQSYCFRRLCLTKRFQPAHDPLNESTLITKACAGSYSSRQLSSKFSQPPAVLRGGLAPLPLRRPHSPPHPPPSPQALPGPPARQPPAVQLPPDHHHPDRRRFRGPLQAQAPDPHHCHHLGLARAPVQARGGRASRDHSCQGRAHHPVPHEGRCRRRSVFRYLSMVSRLAI